MKHTIEQQILDYIVSNGQVKANDISLALGKSRVWIHKYLKLMVENWIIVKYGKAPHVFYGTPPPNEKLQDSFTLDFDSQILLDKRFCSFDVSGKRLDGALGFYEWCNIRKLDIQKQFDQFSSQIALVNWLRDGCGIISQWFVKLKKQVETSYLDALWYLDVYQLWQFGRSRLWNLAFYAKQSQSLVLLKELAMVTIWQIDCLLNNVAFDAVCFAPHSLQRKVQILDFLKDKRNISLPEIKLKKFYIWDVIIPQKSIKWTSQRIRNAKETIFVASGQKAVNSLLLIDDFVWSGATLNESAHKIKEAWLAKTVVWLALVGNVDMSFDVINEV